MESNNAENFGLFTAERRNFGADTQQHTFAIAWSYLVSTLILTPRAADTSANNEIQKLMQDLTSEHFEVREGAMDLLKEREDALPSLRKARRSRDLELRRRVEKILSALEKKRAKHCLNKVKALSDEGRPIAVADRLAYAADYGIAAEEGWGCLTQLAAQVIRNMDSRSFPGFCNNEAFPKGEFSRYAKLVQPKEISQRTITIDAEKPIRRVKNADFDVRLIHKTKGRLLLRGEQVSLLSGNDHGFGISTGIIAASGDVQLSSAIGSLIIAGGDIKKTARLSDCMVICDGDVEFLWPPEEGNVIIARGSVKCATGKIKNCMVRSGHTFLLPDGKMKKIKDGLPDPLAFIKFFELADMGITAENLPGPENSASTAVRLKEVRKGSPLAAGLRIGDVITAIDERKTPTTELFRRVLRRTLAEDGPLITFTVQRGGKKLEVTIPVKD